MRDALITYATEIEYPTEAVIASYLDTEVLGFADFKPGRGQKKARSHPQNKANPTII